MAKVEFISPDGSRRLVEAKLGESIMLAAINNKVPGIIAECGGNLDCATCHVKIDDEWRARLQPPSEEETDMLEATAEPAGPQSRLSCQIPMTEALDGIVVRTALRQR